MGLTLETRSEDVYRALVEATAFGTRVIVESFRAAGLAVDEVVVAGGLVRNRWLLQVYADVLGVARSRRESTPTCRRGGCHGRRPRCAAPAGPGRAAAYDVPFAEYLAMHDRFGRATPVVRRLRELRRQTKMQNGWPAGSAKT